MRLRFFPAGELGLRGREKCSEIYEVIVREAENFVEGRGLGGLLPL
jgi:hypothetical protein